MLIQSYNILVNVEEETFSQKMVLVLRVDNK